MSDFTNMTVKEIDTYLRRNSTSDQNLSALTKDTRAGVREAVRRHLARVNAAARENERLEKMLYYEQEARANGYNHIAGVDEAGRGPLAGPVVAAAVILPKQCLINGLNDSKQVSPVKREELFEEITSCAVAWAVGRGEVDEIESVNILQATKLAMRRSLQSLQVPPDYILLDSLTLEDFTLNQKRCPQKGLTGGDRLSLSIAAASIIAKVTRDRWMCEMDKEFPGYGFAEHKGYPTASHREALRSKGPCPIHRAGFLLLPEEVK